MTTDGPVWAIVLAAGGGTRFGGRKQHEDLGGRTLLQHAVHTVAGACSGVVLVLPADDAADPGAAVAAGATVAVAGGAQRADSVRAGLAAVPADATVVVVADAAHPLAPRALVDRVVAAVRAGADAAVPGLPLTEAVKVCTPLTSGNRTAASIPAAVGIAGATTPAAGHVLAQMPMAFAAAALRRAHERQVAAVEDSAMITADGGTVVVVPGDPVNLHITTPEELALARVLHQAR